MDTGGLTLGIGIISADFQIVGTYPSAMEELKIEQTGSARMEEKSLSIQEGMPSGPGAFLTSIDLSFLSTS